MNPLNMYVSSLEATYIICMAVGTLLSIFSLILGGSHSHTDTGHLVHGHFDHVNHHHGGTDINEGNRVPLLNINALFAFLIGFGAGGFVSYSIFNQIISVLIAISVGILFWYIVRKVLSVMLKNQTKFLDVSVDDALGRSAVVVSKIFPSSIGEVMYLLNGSNKIIRAKSAHSEKIEKGENVLIMKIDKGIAIVEQQENLI